MLCKDLQTKLAVHEELTPAELHHTETCPACAEFAAFDSRLEARVADWRIPLGMPNRRTAARPYRLAYAGLGLAAALTLAVLALPARSSAQEVYRQMLTRVRTVKTVHLVVQWREDGPLEKNPLRKVYELWWKPGAWREQWKSNRPSLKLKEADGLNFYRFDPGSGEVQKMGETGPQEDFATFDLAKFANQYMATPTQFEQPTPTKLIATNAGGWSRMIFTLDPSTGLPTHATKLFKDGKDWKVSGEISLDLDLPVEESHFDPSSLKESAKP